MNGLNGMMEESMDTTEPCSPINNGKTAVPDNDAETNHCENSNNTEDSSQMDSDVSQGTAEPCNNGELTNDNIDSLDCRSNDITTVTPAKGNSNNIVDNNFSNSNESSESVDSHTRKTPDQQTEGHDEKSKDCNLADNQKTITNEETDEVDSEEDSSDDDDESETSTQVRAEETVSINSDSDHENGDDATRDKRTNKMNSDIIIIENDILPDSQNGNDSPSPDIQEILSDNEENDDCVVTEESSVNDKTQLRRSRRMTPRKKYADDDMENGDESDVEEVQMVDPLSKRAKVRPIIINDTKTLVEMAAKQMKNQSNNQKREPTFVIIDSNTGSSNNKNRSHAVSSNSSVNAQIYQNIVARGTTVTPVSAKSNSAAQTVSQVPQPAILPSLTDDMFVVEAPSFIVPYVYEKPSVNPFREFVDKLGKELEELRAKEEQEQLEKDKERKEQEEKERKERGEDVEMENFSETKPDEEDDEEQKKKKKKERRRRRNDDDDASWDGESSGESDDDVISDEDKTVLIKDKVDTIEDIKEVTGLTVEKVVTAKADNYFDCSLGKFFMNIGLNLVQEYVQNDLLKQQNRKLQREKKSGANTRATLTAVASLSKNLEFSKEANAPYRFPQNKCEFCSFKTESKLVMSHHLETPHMKNNVYKCNYCTFEIRSPHDILYHMESEHKVRGKLERAPAYHQCANCPFEDNGKGKLARHLIPCAKKFKPDSNLAPPIEWEPPAKIPKIARSRNTTGGIIGTYQSAFNRAALAGAGRPPLGAGGAGGACRPRGRSPMPAPPRAAPLHGLPVARGGLVVRHNAPVPVGIITPNNFAMANNSKNSKSSHQPSISITPLPRQPAPLPPQPHPSQHAKNTFVICEICDGYIKDLEQLRNHMQWIHKVKIHPKMIYNRPPLNCQKCQFRFFTDQGLERHLLGSHGLVTSSMQEAANKGKDAGRCPVCGRVYQWKLLNHVGRDHNLTLKPAHLSYKCTVCTATFGMYKQFENHVYSAHSVVAKRVMDKNKSAPPAKTSNDSLLKPLKINDEITIIPQPATASRAPASSGKDK